MVILLYYVLATLLPIDKLIGKLYPVFGVILIVMALSVLGSNTLSSNVTRLDPAAKTTCLSFFSFANAALPIFSMEAGMVTLATFES